MSLCRSKYWHFFCLLVCSNLRVHHVIVHKSGFTGWWSLDPEGRLTTSTVELVSLSPQSEAPRKVGIARRRVAVNDIDFLHESVDTQFPPACTCCARDLIVGLSQSRGPMTNRKLWKVKKPTSEEKVDETKPNLHLHMHCRACFLGDEDSRIYIGLHMFVTFLLIYSSQDRKIKMSTNIIR